MPTSRTIALRSSPSAATEATAESTKPSTGSERLRAIASMALKPCAEARAGTAIHTLSSAVGACAARRLTNSAATRATVRSVATGCDSNEPKCRVEAAVGWRRRPLHAFAPGRSPVLPSQTALGALDKTRPSRANETDRSSSSIANGRIDLQVSLGKLTLLSADCFGSGAMVGSSRIVADSSGTWGAPGAGGLAAGGLTVAGLTGTTLDAGRAGGAACATGAVCDAAAG